MGGRSRRAAGVTADHAPDTIDDSPWPSTAGSRGCPRSPSTPTVADSGRSPCVLRKWFEKGDGAAVFREPCQPAPRSAASSSSCVAWRVVEPPLRLGRHGAALVFERDLDQQRGAFAGGAGDLEWRPPHEYAAWLSTRHCNQSVVPAEWRSPCRATGAPSAAGAGVVVRATACPGRTGRCGVTDGVMCRRHHG
jgi:hypothetical protein